MTFEQLFPYFAVGVPIKRKPWGGYWKYDIVEDVVYMFTKEGTILPLTETKDILFTLSNVVADDWQIATNENCVIQVT